MSVHVIHFFGPLSQASVEQLRNCVLTGTEQQGATEICLHLSSEGGNLTAAFTAYHFLRSLAVPVTTHNLGNVESAAVLVYLAGATRLAVSHSRFMLHSLHWGFTAGSVDHDRLAEHARSLDFDAERYAKVFDERTSGAQQPANVRQHLAGRASILEPQAAIAAGIATAISDATTHRGATHWWPDVVKVA